MHDSEIEHILVYSKNVDYKGKKSRIFEIFEIFLFLCSEFEKKKKLLIVCFFLTFVFFCLSNSVCSIFQLPNLFLCSLQHYGRTNDERRTKSTLKYWVKQNCLSWLLNLFFTSHGNAMEGNNRL